MPPYLLAFEMPQRKQSEMSDMGNLCHQEHCLPATAKGAKDGKREPLHKVLAKNNFPAWISITQAAFLGWKLFSEKLKLSCQLQDTTWLSWHCACVEWKTEEGRND